MKNNKVKKLGILGTGNIGTDLLIKLLDKGYENIAFVGRRSDSEGIKRAKLLDVVTSTEGIDFFKKNPNYDVVFDCTNAFDANEHYSILRNLNIKVIDLTPAKLGQICVPEINGIDVKYKDNINLITCGGQASLPIIYTVCNSLNYIEYIEIISQISSKSAGMSTRINVDNYIQTTEYAITYFTKVENCKVILNVNPAEPCVNMQTSVFIKVKSTDNINFEEILYNTASKLQAIKSYVPFYELSILPSIIDENIIMFSIKVKGKGDYLPEYAGNLDIINCCAIRALEYL